MDQENQPVSGNDNSFQDNASPAPEVAPVVAPSVESTPVVESTPAPTPAPAPVVEQPPLIGGQYNVKNQTAKQPKPARNGSPNGGAVVLATFALILGGLGLILGAMAYFGNNNQANQPTSTVSEDGYYTGNSVEFESTSIAAIVQKVTPAVVSIISESYSSSSYSYYGGTVQSAGTGMIVTKDGDEGNAGTLYVTINPNTVDFTGQVLTLENSQAEASKITLGALKQSDKTLTFGWTRAAGNGFYEAPATLAAAATASMRLPPHSLLPTSTQYRRLATTLPILRRL